MSNIQDNKAVERINETIEKLKSNDFTFYFFTVDSKNIPNGSVAYIYRLAKTLQDKGYNVKMLYQLEDEYTEGDLYKLRKNNDAIDYNKVFEGVEEWLGKEYSSLPHMNIATEEFSVSASDFLFIPEAFSSLMYETYKHKLPCKRYVILQNFDYVTDFIPIGVEWKNYGIYDVITTSENQSRLIKNVFPYVKTHILPPCISEEFRKPLVAKNLVVNIVTKDQNDINKIVKQFYWKYPMYKFISFRDLRNFPREKFAEFLQDSPITVWVDEKTPFGYVPLEAMRCDSIVIGKVPEITPEWMVDEEGIINNGLWVYDINDIPNAIALAIGSWMRDEVSEELITEMKKTNQLYTVEEWNNNITSLFNEIINNQIANLEEVKEDITKVK